MKLRKNLKLFALLYFGNASDKERKKVFESKESKKMLEKDWEQSNKNNQLSKAQKNTIYLNIQDQMFSGKKHVSAGKQLSNFMRKYAALLILVLSLSVTVTYILTSESTRESANYVTKENPAGERSGFLLPDGTKVWLNADSKLTYPETFSDNRREVKLTGEAYFEVKKNKQKLFKVITEDVEIEVLGTVFNVSAYPGEKTIETTLVSGKVAVSDNSHAKEKHRYILNKGHLAVFNKEKREFKLDKVDVYQHTSWKDGKLIFDHAAFSEIQKKLERVYDVKFEDGVEMLDQYHYTMTLTDESIDDIMQLICKTTPVEYTIEGKHIYIKEKKK